MEHEKKSQNKIALHTNGRGLTKYLLLAYKSKKNKNQRWKLGSKWKTQKIEDEEQKLTNYIWKIYIYVWEHWED